MRPSGPIQTVDRITPTIFLPYIVFSPYAPYDRMTLRSGSESSMNGSRYLDANRWCEAASSPDTPITTAPSSRRSSQASRKPHASLVQPGVSSRG